MGARIKILRVAALLVVAGGGAYAYDALRGPSEPGFFQGYIEGEAIRVAAPVSGTLAKLMVQRGQSVRAGDPLFEFDLTDATATRDQAAESQRYAEAQLKRQQELVATRAS